MIDTMSHFGRPFSLKPDPLTECPKCWFGYNDLLGITGVQCVPFQLSTNMCHRRRSGQNSLFNHVEKSSSFTLVAAAHVRETNDLPYWLQCATDQRVIACSTPRVPFLHPGDQFQMGALEPCHQVTLSPFFFVWFLQCPFTHPVG